jgi:signal transduction histidine kinase
MAAPVALPWVTLVDGDPVARAQRLPRPSRLLLQLAVAAALVFGVVLVGASFAASRLAEREAVNDAAHTANLLALAVVQPALTDALLTGDAAAYAAIDAVVREAVLPNGIVRVKLWRPDGTIVYADERRLVGQRFPLGDDQLEALANPRTSAEVSELARSENEFERYGGKLLEVYRPIWTPEGTELLFEVYGDYGPVQQRSDDLWRGLAGLLASSLLLLLVLLTPILWRVLDRVRAAQLQREELLQRAVDASDQERRRIAATLHDGPVQELVAGSLAVSGAAEQAQSAGQPTLAKDIREAAATVRASVASLRSLLVDIYPERLADSGLAAALADLTRPLAARGTDVSLDLDPAVVADLDESRQQLLYRVTRECLRNVAKHAGAQVVYVSILRDAGEPGSPVVLDVSDDGVGFDSAPGRSPHGHFGIRVLADLARDAGARLLLATAPGSGTRWRLVLDPTPGGPARGSAAAGGAIP